MLCKIPPPELLAMAYIVVLRLYVRLQQQLKELDPDTSGNYNLAHNYWLLLGAFEQRLCCHVVNFHWTTLLH